MSSSPSENPRSATTFPHANPSATVDPNMMFQLLAALQQQVIQQNLFQSLFQQGPLQSGASLIRSPISSDDKTKSSSPVHSSEKKMDSTPTVNTTVPISHGIIFPNLLLPVVGALQMPYIFQMNSIPIPPRIETVIEPSPSISPLHKERRIRTPSGPYRMPYTEPQLEILEANYAEDRFVSGEKKEKLVKMTGLTHRQIKLWYQNRRAKDQRKGRASSKTPESSEDSEAGENGNESSCIVSWNHQFGLSVEKEKKTEEQDVEIDVMN